MSLNLDKSRWKRVIFGDVVQNITERIIPADANVDRYVGLEHLDPGVMTVQRWDRPDVVEGQKLRFHADDVIFGRRRAYQKKVARADFEGICSAHALVLRARPDFIDAEFLPVFLSSDYFLNRAISISVGSLSPTVNWRDLKVQEFDLPPLDEQKRIADLLWALERHRLQLTTSVRSVVEAVDVRLRALWESATGKRAIGEVADCVTGSTPSKSNGAYWNSKDVPFYTPSEIDGDTMSAARQRVSTAGASAGRLLPEFAVAVACIGGDMGKSAVIREPGISNQQITSIVGLTSDDAYLMQSLLAHPRGRLALEARETTTIVRKLNKSDLMKVEVPWPEDRLVVRRLVKHRRETVAAITQEALSQRVLVSALLAEIFGGD